MTDLDKLIADSIEQAEIEEREERRRADAEQAELERLMKEATLLALAEIKDLPRALIPYCRTEPWPNCHGRAETIVALKGGWKPIWFTVEAPGMARIEFRVVEKVRDIVCGSIMLKGARVEYKSWHQAIAAAASAYRIYNKDDQEY